MLKLNEEHPPLPLPGDPNRGYIILLCPPPPTLSCHYSALLINTPLCIATPVSIRISFPIPICISSPISIRISSPIPICISFPISIRIYSPIPISISSPIAICISSFSPICYFPPNLFPIATAAAQIRSYFLLLTEIL